jgi:hypothetical protein
MKSDITTNASLCLLNDHSKDVCLPITPYKVGRH